MSYSNSDCFETFAFPGRVDALHQSGEAYFEWRSRVMRIRREGLTKIYNRFHDSDEASADIQKLRQLHVEMDDAVTGRG